MKRLALTAVAALALLAGLGAPAGIARPTVARAQMGSVPVLAYYYIWFDEASWSRAKIDYPILGRYSSDDAAVMEQHIIWAQAAGIDGFIVSWKSTPKLNARLDQLSALAAKHNFKLSIIYQALDFARQPLTVQEIHDDLQLFTTRWAPQPAFQMFKKPLLILSGTREFTPNEIQEAIGNARERALILASERNAAAFQKIASLVDGDAYYWSSVNPDVYVGAEDKLTDIGSAVHARSGVWIAPAAPGFDARLIGGKRVIDRNAGDTLRAEMGTALASSPDAVGIISWNEFSENSHVEPSTTYGGQSLETLGELTGSKTIGSYDFDSSEPSDTREWAGLDRIAAFAGFGLLILASLVAIGRRGRRSSGESASQPASPGTSTDSPN